MYLQRSDKNSVLVESLLAMRNSLVSSYEMKTTVTEENLLLKAIRNPVPDYIVFSGYRRNDGKKRIQDAVEIIDEAVHELEDSDCIEPSRIYLSTLKSVARTSKMATVLEYSAMSNKSKEKEAEGKSALRAAN